MALTEYQRSILALLASRRIAKQESYLAGGAALIVATDSRRLSRDIDFAKFWLDPEPTLVSSWGLAPKELNSLEQVVRDNLDLFRRKWDERFGA